MNDDAEVHAIHGGRTVGNFDRAAQVCRLERGTRAFAAIDRALFALERNAGVKLVADWLVLQL